MNEEINNMSKYLWDFEKMMNPKPAFIELDLTNWCNLNCEWCCSAKQRQQKMNYMNSEIFERELQYAIKNGCGIVLTGGGEPTLSPLFPLFIERLKREFYNFKIPAVALVTNGTITKWIRLFLETFPPDRSWVRVSLNDREPKKELLELMKQYPKRIGISLIWGKENERIACVKNASDEFMKNNAKLIRIRSAIDYSKHHEERTPDNCVGRKFTKVIESTGVEAFCCQSRGFDGHPRFQKCPLECRWADFDLKKMWEEYNPFT